MAAPSCLQSVQDAFKSNSTITSTITDSYTLSEGKTALISTCTRVQTLLKEEGIRTARLSKREVSFFFKDAPTATPGTFTAAEYQALIETLTKYAALKARHNNGKRWGLGVGLSAAGAVALTAAVFSSAGLLLVAAAPAGAAIGAVAVAADGSSSRRRDRRTAKRSNTASSSNTEIAPAAAAVPTDAPEGPIAEQVVAAEEAAAVKYDGDAAAAMVAAPAVVAAEEAAAAAVAPAVPAPSPPAQAAMVSSAHTSPRGSSELQQQVVTMAGGVPAAQQDALPATPAASDAVDTSANNSRSSNTQQGVAAKPTVLTTIDATAGSTDDDCADVPAPVACDSPFAAASRDRDTHSTAADVPPLMLAPPAAVKTNSSSDVLMSFGSSGQLTSGQSGSALLPPKPKKSKSLKKMSKSLNKSLKKAFSLKDKDAVKSSPRGDADGDDNSPLAPPVPAAARRSLTFFRRSSSDLGAVDGALDVEGSKGSATLKKFGEALRRSFSLDRPSMELFTPKKARKSSTAE